MMPFRRGISMYAFSGATPFLLNESDRVRVNETSVFRLRRCAAALAHDACSDERIVSRAFDPDLGEQCAIVLAELRRGRSDRTGRAGQPRNHMMHRKRAHVRIGIVR